MIHEAIISNSSFDTKSMLKITRKLWMRPEEDHDNLHMVSKPNDLIWFIYFLDSCSCDKHEKENWDLLLVW